MLNSVRYTRPLYSDTWKWGENGWKKDDVSLHVDGCNWLIYSWQSLKKVNFKTLKSELDDAHKRCWSKGNAECISWLSAIVVKITLSLGIHRLCSCVRAQRVSLGRPSRSKTKPPEPSLGSAMHENVRHLSIFQDTHMFQGREDDEATDFKCLLSVTLKKLQHIVSWKDKGLEHVRYYETLRSHLVEGPCVKTWF